MSDNLIMSRARHVLGRTVYTRDDKDRAVCHTRQGRIVRVTSGDKFRQMSFRTIEFPTVREAKAYLASLTN